MKKALSIGFVAAALVSCAQPVQIQHPRVPSLDYANNLRRQQAMDQQFAGNRGAPQAHYGFSSASAEAQPAMDQARGRLHYVKEVPPDSPYYRDADPLPPVQNKAPEVLSNLNQDAPDYEEYRSSQPTVRDYNGPLSLGDPGVSASLWQESRGGSELFRDYRAYQPMDLVTIVISEESEGTKEADTKTETESDILLGISSLFGFENDAIQKNSDAATGFTFDPSQLVQAGSVNDYEIQGETTRKGSLKARISAMVVEVLPGGTLRIEGEKIIAVNNEEQIMVISGLVRTRDVNSANEIDSGKIANLRIDYFGRGTVGEGQEGGWGGRVLRRIWPF